RGLERVPAQVVSALLDVVGEGEVLGMHLVRVGLQHRLAGLLVLIDETEVFHRPLPSEGEKLWSRSSRTEGPKIDRGQAPRSTHPPPVDTWVSGVRLIRSEVPEWGPLQTPGGPGRTPPRRPRTPARSGTTRRRWGRSPSVRTGVSSRPSRVQGRRQAR